MTVQISSVVIVPWRGGCPHREAAWEWVRPRLEALGWPVVVAEHGEGPWVKASVVMPAIEASTADVVVVHDADVWVPALRTAVEAVEQGAPWAMPHTMVYRLTEASTKEVLDGADPVVGACEEQPYPGVMSGGVVVLRRDIALQVPMPWTEGWGSEDHCWGWALACFYGDPWRAIYPLFHLWHPPPDRIDRMNGSYPAQQLRRRYFDARYDRPAMQALVEEGRREWLSKSPSTGPA